MKKKYLIIGIVSILILSIGAYFAVRIVGDGKEATSADLKVTFKNDKTITYPDIMPGWTSTKTFTVKNESNETYEYDIVIKNLVNTFVTTGGLQYKITSDNDGYNMSDYADVPKSATATDTVLAFSVSIPVGVTQTYTIEFIYPDTGEDQSENVGKTFSGSLAITEGTTDPNLKLYDKLLSDNPTRLTRTSFDTAFEDENVNTLYTVDGNWTEDGSTVYYFAGNAQNNWVKFGQEAISNCEYNGEKVKYYTGITYRHQMTAAECTSTNVCSFYIGSNINAYVGLTKEKCMEKYSDWEAIYEGTATYTEETKDTYWRIIRTNEDGSIRLLYAGTSPDTEAAYIVESIFNNIISNPLYVGYMYGTSGSLENNRTNETSSEIKMAADNWYARNLLVYKDTNENTYDSYVSKTAIYCNDRSTKAYSPTTTMYFGAYDRLDANKQPSYKCGNDATGTLYSTADVADKFSVSTTSGGNGDLTYPIALMTADEIAYAGGKVNTTAKAWYYYNSVGESMAGSSRWYTMSPASATSTFDRVFSVFGSDYPGRLHDSLIGHTPGVRPVISLKSCVLVSGGNGSSSNPYVVNIDSECVTAEN